MDIPFVELGIAWSVVILGIAVALQWNLPVATAMARVRLFAGRGGLVAAAGVGILTGVL